MAGIIPKWRIGIRAKLYSAAVLATIAVAILTVASFHFARVTDVAADHLYHEGFEGVENSTELQSLLEGHRRIVESAPAEVDRRRLAASERAMVEKSRQISALLTQLMTQPSDPEVDAIEKQMLARMPQLIERSERVIFFATNFAQDKAIDAAADYATSADEIQELIKAYRSRRMKLAESSVLVLSDSARTLTVWVAVSAFIALMLIGPIGLATTRGVLSRIERITDYMSRLASHGEMEAVPSRGDHDEVGNMARAVQVFKDNGAELLQRESELEQVSLHRDVALNNMAHGLSMFDSRHRLIICNGRYTEMYGLPAELVRPSTPLQDILNYRLAHGMLSGSPAKILAAQATAGSGTSSAVREMPDGRTIFITTQRKPDGGWVAVHEDITERRRSEARIAHLARHDQLTNLPNRVFFHEVLDEAVQNLQRGKHFAVHCLDLDRFKSVNDSLGHPVGDALLTAVGDRLRGCVQASDFVARLGGDEFAIIQTNVRTPEECSNLASRIIDAVNEPCVIAGHQIIVGTSVGIAMAPDDGKSADQLLKNADVAMYRAKSDGRGAYRLFEPEMDALIQARRALEVELRHALASNELQLYYQPLVDPKRGIVTGLEALLRWFHPRLGEIPPSEFIPLAEETGLISSLGDWIFRTACAEACNWPQHIRVAVNLSSVQVKNGNICQVILSALAGCGLPANRLEIEITESVLLDNDVKTLSMLNELRSFGVRIAMDDFGTGYSSLSYLRSFPVDKIKIDRSFIRDLASKEEARAIVRAITSLARALDIRVVAEGIETAEQLKFVLAEGCDEVQGYFFSPPRPASDVGEMLSRCNKLRGMAA